MAKKTSSLMATELGMVVTMAAETRRQAHSNPDRWPPVSVNLCTWTFQLLIWLFCEKVWTKVLHYLGECQQRGRMRRQWHWWRLSRQKWHSSRMTCDWTPRIILSCFSASSATSFLQSSPLYGQRSQTLCCPKIDNVTGVHNEQISLRYLCLPDHHARHWWKA